MNFDDMFKLAHPKERKKLILDHLILGNAILDSKTKNWVDPLTIKGVRINKDGTLSKDGRCKEKIIKSLTPKKEDI